MLFISLSTCFVFLSKRDLFGGPQGIGLAIVRQLALQYPTSPLNGGPLLIYLTARDQRRGEDAVKNLEQDSQLHEAKALRAEGGLTDIQFHALDITDSNSVNAFVRDLKETHGDGIDFVINNAGIAMDGFGKLPTFRPLRTFEQTVFSF